MIELFTDGASRGNPGPGGYGVLLRWGPHVKELTAGFRKTTNNRMELLAVIVGLEAITKPGIPITVYSDSKSVVDAVEKRWALPVKLTAICGLGSCAFMPNTTLNLSGFEATPATPKTNVATNSPWPAPYNQTYLLMKVLSRGCLIRSRTKIFKIVLLV